MSLESVDCERLIDQPQGRLPQTAGCMLVSPLALIPAAEVYACCLRKDGIIMKGFYFARSDRSVRFFAAATEPILLSTHLQGQNRRPIL